MTTLPVRIRQHIRDYIASPTCPLVLRTEAVKAVLGYRINLDPEWTMLWKTLQAYYPDPATFIPTIARTIIIWCDAFTTWLENEGNEEMVDQLMQGLKGKQIVELMLEISPSSDRPTTLWRANKSVFVIALPKTEVINQSTSLAGFNEDFLNLFTASPIMGASNVTTDTAAKMTRVEDTDGWADLELESPKQVPVLRTKPDFNKRDGEADSIPEVSTLPRPEELTKRPPYWMVVRQEGAMRVVIEASHGPSLACLEAYLGRWCRGEPSRANRTPVVEIKLHESAFGFGLLNDKLSMEAIRGREVSAMIVLVFVEHVLGYAPVSGSSSFGSVWEFRRFKPFK